MHAKGTFEIKLTPQEDAEAPVGRLIINKTYSGDMTGTGTGQMISKRTESGVAIYYAIEEFTGQVNGKSGSFTLVHSGHMDSESQTLDVTVLHGSSSGELEGISGSMGIIQDDGGHSYFLDYEL